MILSFTKEKNLILPKNITLIPSWSLILNSLSGSIATETTVAIITGGYVCNPKLFTPRYPHMLDYNISLPNVCLINTQRHTRAQQCVQTCDSMTTFSMLISSNVN